MCECDALRCRTGAPFYYITKDHVSSARATSSRRRADEVHKARNVYTTRWICPDKNIKSALSDDNVARGVQIRLKQKTCVHHSIIYAFSHLTGCARKKIHLI